MACYEQDIYKAARANERTKEEKLNQYKQLMMIMMMKIRLPLFTRSTVYFVIFSLHVLFAKQRTSRVRRK